MEWQTTAIPEMVPQYDLLAMQHNFVMEVEPWDEHPDEWVFIVFKQPDIVEE